MSKNRAERRFMVGGIDKIEGKWVAFFETHYPCDGSETHRTCRIIDRHISPQQDTEEQAIDLLKEIQESSGLREWKASGHKA